MGLLQGLLPLLVARLHTHLGADWDWSGKMAAPATVAAVGTEAILQTGVASKQGHWSSGCKVLR